MTEKLYEGQPLLTAFSARVLGCEPTAKGFAVVLDKTAFFPEGGGQPCDRGTLAGIPVAEVHEKDGQVLHTLSAALPMGETVEGLLDEAFRRDAMEQHTGEHILSGILHSLYGAENVGFHIGADTVRMDMSVELTADQLAEAERRANAIVRADVPVAAEYPDAQTLAAMTYRSKKALDGAVRIVTIPGADRCACCGTHLPTTGRVGVIKILTAQNYKGGVRLAVACGGRAFAALAAEHAATLAISGMLSAKPEAIAEAVQRLQAEGARLREQKAAAESHWFAALAAAADKGQRQLLCQDGLDPDALRRLALALAESTDALAAVFSKTEAGFAYALAGPEDVRPVGKGLNAALNGRGGGKPGLVQGSLACTDFAEVEAFFAAPFAAQ